MNSRTSRGTSILPFPYLVYVVMLTILVGTFTMNFMDMNGAENRFAGFSPNVVEEPIREELVLSLVAGR